MNIPYYKTSLILLISAMLLTGCILVQGTGEKKADPAVYHYQMGLSYLSERNFTGALVELTEAEKLDPDNPELLYRLALAYLGKKRPDLAEKKLLRALKLKPNFSAARNDLGFAYLELKRWDDAIQQFKTAKDDLFYEGTENATINLGLAYLGKGDYAKALDELQGIAKLSPRNPIIHLSIGRVWFAMDKTDQAIAEYRKALAIYKDYGAAYYYLGLALMKLNKIEEARSAFKEVLRIFPESDLGRASRNYLDLISKRGSLVRDAAT